jgi:hypothetical protein
MGAFVRGSKTLARGALLAATVAIVVAVGGGGAYAGSWHSMSGTVPSSGWYLSTNIRTTDGPTIQTQLTSRPSEGVEWQLISFTSGKEFGTQQDINSSSNYTNATDVISGTRYENRYAQDSSCSGFSCNYNFSGQQYY